MIRPILAFAASLLAAAPSQAETDLRALQAMEARVAAIHWRLVTANVAQCREPAPHAGLMVHTLTQYASAARAQARATFGLDARPGVFAVVRGGPADRAGVKVGDTLLALDGHPLLQVHSDGPFGYGDVDRVEAALRLALNDGVVMIRLERNSVPMTVAVTGDLGCDVSVSLVPGRKPQAWASDDHRTVSITMGLVEAAANDDEIAFVLAHEVVHTIRRDAWMALPKSERLAAARMAEDTADRIGVSLAAAAGYEPMAAPRLVARLGTRIDSPGLGRRTHRRWQDRVRQLTAIAAPLRAARPAQRESAQ